MVFNPVKIALPKGRLLRKTAAMLQKAGWGIDEYHSSMGFYRPRSSKFPDLLIRVFHEKDIPIQIALGNYDLGICSLDWIEELMVKYPAGGIVKVKDLGYNAGRLYLAAASLPPGRTHAGDLVRIATEYPNLAEAYALKCHMGRFAVFPVWGAAEVYPPENADLVLISSPSRAEMEKAGLTAVDKVLNYSAFLIANRRAWETRDLDDIVSSIFSMLPEKEKTSPPEDVSVSLAAPGARSDFAAAEFLRLALPDGHQQQHVVKLLNMANISISGYPSPTGERCPRIALEHVAVKVIRPQDMPLQVANGNFDLALTGHDWVTDHLAQFPSSPVRELADLKMGRVRMVAVVAKALPFDDTAGLRNYITGRDEPFRVASEYVNIADKYARDNHLGRYRVIPTWGATEAFLPDDADLLIENTETGRTIARHNLKIIDTLFESTGCLIGHKDVATGSRKGKLISALVKKLTAAVEVAP